MNIAFVSDSIYPYNMGGKEKRLYEIAIRLAKKGHDVHVYTMHWWKTPEKTRIEDGVTLHAIAPLWPLYNGEIRSIKQGVLFALHCFKMIKYPFDIADVDHMPYFPLFSMKVVCLLKRKSMVAPWHEVWGRDYWVEYMGWAGNIAAAIEYAGTFLPNHIVAIADHTKQRMKAKIGRTKNVTVVPCGIDYKLIQKVSPAVDQVDILYVGRLIAHKNVALLLESIVKLAATYPSINAQIIGRGPELQNLQQLSKKLGIAKNVVFIERLPKSTDIYAHMKAAKVLAFPSEREGFGIVAIESIACGTPVVTLGTKDNVSRTLITEGVTGSVVPKDAQAFAKALEYWLTSPKSTIHEHAVKYEWDSIANQIEKVYAL